ncbi:streptomycin biosynthesis protein StrI [Hortaea werneckii]|nr:streptomycin biosynthesis protein StrI [Hortaea werneckii]
MTPLANNASTVSGIGNGRGEIDDQLRFLIVGAGSRGAAYAAAILRSGLAVVAGVVEPVPFKRQLLGSQYIWANTGTPERHQQFADWKDYITFERQRRKDAVAGLSVPPGMDGVFVCVRDDLHAPVVNDLAPLGLHIMCEKPLATSLSDCLKIQFALNAQPEPRIFAIGHVLRYSPHNMLLRHLLLEEKVVGEVLSMEHTEPIGYWHFSHSYVRGQWRTEKMSAPSLLTKSCHDIDFILWMLCSAIPEGSQSSIHLPTSVSSVGSLKQFRRSMKPREAGSATNCLSCPIRYSCLYSAPKIYDDQHLAKGIVKWPIDVVNPMVPSIFEDQGKEAARSALLATLAEDYDAASTPTRDIEDHAWYGRCVWESDNDVCDDQTVTLTWEDDFEVGRGAKTAVFHMIAQTLAQCERRGRFYGTTGEISYDSKSITVHDFKSGETRTRKPEVPVNSHHGGGDDGLTQCFLNAVKSVKSGSMDVAEAQRYYMGCTLEDVIRSHAAVFAAEEARREKKVISWVEWWEQNVVT